MMDPDANIEALHQRIRELEKEASQQKKTAQMLRKQNVYLTALHETTLGLIRRLDVTDVLKTIIRHTASLAGTQHSFLYLYDEKEDVLRLKIGLGIYQNQIGYVIRRGEGVAGRVFNTASSLVINDYRSWEGRHSNSIWKSVRAVAALPLKSGHQMVGVIGALYTQAGQKFEDEILDLLNPFAELVSIALDNARLHLNLQKELQDRIQAEAALQEKEATMRSILQAAPLGIGMVNNFKDRVIVWTNAKFTAMLGYSPEELKGRPASRLYVSKNEFERVGRVKHPEMKAKGVGSLEAHMQHKDGRAIAVLLSSALINPEDPNSEVVFTALDITARKAVENSLRESEERFRELAELMPEVIFEMEMDGRLTFANRKAYDRFGYSKEELQQGLNAFDLMVPEDKDRAILNHSRIIAGENLGLNEYRARRKDGSIFPVIVRSAAILQAGKPIGLRGFMIDITERKKVEEQLQQVQRMEALGTLAGGIAHDFNNLMMGIQGNASLALLDLDRQHPNYERLRSIEQQVKKATDLTRQMLGLARGGKYEVSPHNLNDVINDCVRMFSRTKKEIAVYKKFENPLWTVKIDRGQIDQVLLNIFVNAWQAMPGGGSLYIQSENVILEEAYVTPHNVRPGNYVKVTITDTGIGMHKKILNRVFDPFFTAKEKERGTGLGLASAYGIIQNHQGIITADSQAGQGATFSVCLPASEVKIKQIVPPEIKIDSGAETVLLVDDEDIIVDVGSHMLKKMGYTVFAAHSGREALDVFEAQGHRIDIVILDMIMPDLSGSATFDRIRTMNPDTKVLLASGYSRDGQAEDIINRGCDGFIQKPFDMEQLSDKLRKVLGTKTHDATGKLE